MKAGLALTLCALACTGCTVGPDFRAPDPPAVERYTPGEPLSSPGLPKLVVGADVPGEWWAVFGAPEIDALVARALLRSPTLAQARARLRQAQELQAARTGAAQSPQIDATLGAVRQRIDPATFGFPQAPNPGPFNVFSLGAEVSYNFDLFGGLRRELEALASEVDYQRYEAEAARLLLAGQVVATAIRAAALDAQMEAFAEILAAQRRQLAIAEARLDAGAVSVLEVQNRRLAVAQAESALPPLLAQRARAGHLLAVLAGDAPGAGEARVPRLAELGLPPELPLRLPSELVRQRPDIRASEALWHKASANLGLATADLYPRLVIGGSFASSQLSASEVLGSGINIWNIGANLLQPLWRGGELKARQRAAEAALDQAAAAYGQSVLLGLQSVADVLRMLEADSAAFVARTDQAARADDAYRVTAGRLAAGGVSELALLEAGLLRSQARLDLLQVQAGRQIDVAALFQALGGGWPMAAPDRSAEPGRQ